VCSSDLHLADRQLDELSGGERQRVVLAQALAQDASILLLDEPTTHLDPRHVLDVLGTVRRMVRERGTAALAIFHDLNLASVFCDRLYALADGAVAAAGTPADVIERSLLREVYGVEADVSSDPGTGRPVVFLTPPPDGAGRPRVRRAHVIGGAGRGAAVMRALAEAGFEVTAGVLHATDSDAMVAERLNLLRLTVPPFSEVDAGSVAGCVELATSASAVVVCDPPFGPGNVGNLRVALAARDAGVPIYLLLGGTPIEDRDFTGGEATRLWRELTDGAVAVRTPQELLAAVRGP